MPNNNAMRMNGNVIEIGAPLFFFFIIIIIYPIMMRFQQLNFWYALG